MESSDGESDSSMECCKLVNDSDAMEMVAMTAIVRIAVVVVQLNKQLLLWKIYGNFDSAEMLMVGMNAYVIMKQNSFEEPHNYNNFEKTQRSNING